VGFFKNFNSLVKFILMWIKGATTTTTFLHSFIFGHFYAAQEATNDACAAAVRTARRGGDNAS
jgi:hypothetical protein